MSVTGTNWNKPDLERLVGNVLVHPAEASAAVRTAPAPAAGFTAAGVLSGGIDGGGVLTRRASEIVGFGLNGVWSANGDGAGDFGVPTYASTGFGANGGWQADKHVRALADLTGSGGLDIVGFGFDGVWTARGNGDGTFGSGTFVLENLGLNQGWQVGKNPRLMADLSGDGKADIVGFGNDGVWTALGKGDGSFQALRFVLANLGANQGWGIEQPRLMADLNGDGKADIIGFGNDGVWTALGTGDGGFQAPRLGLADFGVNQGWRTEKHVRVLTDLTGDRKADIVAFGNNGVWTALGNGDGTFQAPRLVIADFGVDHGWDVAKHVRLLTDLTGDGRADLVAFGNDGVWTALGKGDGTFQPARFVVADLGFNQGWLGDQHPRFMLDLNNDGRADIVGFGNAGVWTALGTGDGGFQAPRFVLADFGAQSGQTAVKHVIVLMMENRSFDHFLGFSAISGADAETGLPRAIDGLKGTESNSYEGQAFTVTGNATDRIDPGPPHQFNDVLISLSGPQFDNHNLNGGGYPAIDGSGYAAAYGIVTEKASAGKVMDCFQTGDLPIVTALAKEFVVCDAWYSAMAGPTEPNRMFVHAASSSVYDDSPTEMEQAEDELEPGGGITFPNGTIYDRLRAAHVPFRIYAGDHFPNVAELKGVSIVSDIREFGDLAGDLHNNYDAAYTFIEPDYSVVTLSAQFYQGNSQHPPGSVAAGERLIKQVYETIRASPVWNSCMLVVVWDEHGGFYDHVRPPRATRNGQRGRSHGYMFDQYGPRVPAIVISPLIPKNLVEHRRLEHSVIPATLEQMFGLEPLTVRDAELVGLQSLATLRSPRADTPLTLPPVVVSPHLASLAANVAAADMNAPISTRLDDWLGGTIVRAAQASLELEPTQSAAIAARVNGLKTVGDAQAFLTEVAGRVTARRTAFRAATTTTQVTTTQVTTTGAGHATGVTGQAVGSAGAPAKSAAVSPEKAAGPPP